jgi:hypothetical protein
MDALDSGNPAESSDATYYFWLACAQYREAAEFLRKRKPPEVAAFMAQLPPDVQQHWAKVAPSFTPYEGSFVDKVLRPLRNKLFHYPEPGSKEMERALRAASQHISGVRVVGEEKLGNVRGVFADEVRARLLGEYLHGANDEDEDEELGLRETMRKISRLMSSLIAFAHGSLAEYLVQLPPGVVTLDEASPPAG